MDDLTRRLREANPYADRKLPESGERLLRDLQTRERNRPLSAAEPGTARRPRYIVLFVLSVAVTVLLLSTVGLFARPHAAIAVTPQPLPVRPITITSEGLLKEIRSAASPSLQASNLGYVVEGWYFQYDSDAADGQYIQAQRIESDINPDGSGITRIFAGTPVDEHGTPLSPPPDDAPKPGALLEEMPAAPGELLTMFAMQPPETADRMRLYLDRYLASSGMEPAGDYGAGDYASALGTLMQTWTLSDAAQQAAIEVILTSDGVKIAGSTVDRIGREGILLDLAPATFSSQESHDQLVIDTQNWRVLASETISIDGSPEFNISPGDVTSYTIWR